MTIEQTIEQIDALEAKATKGPWAQSSDGQYVDVAAEQDGDGAQITWCETKDDAAFIYPIRNAWPAISEEMRRLKSTEAALVAANGEIERLRKALQTIVSFEEKRGYRTFEMWCAINALREDDANAKTI